MRSATSRFSPRTVRSIASGERAGSQRPSSVSARPANVYDFYALVGAMSFVFVSPAGARRIWDTDPFSDAFVERYIETIISLFRHGWSQPGDAGTEPG